MRCKNVLPKERAFRSRADQVTESALYACDRPSLFERSELWGGVRGGVLGPVPGDGKRALRVRTVFIIKAKRNRGGLGGWKEQAQMTESALYACDRSCLIERSEIGGVGLGR